MIEIKSVTKKYGNNVVIDNINLTVESSSVLGLAGFNGCGKTTLLNICAGIFKPENGEVLLDGETVFNNTSNKRNLFYVPDNMWFPVGATIKSAANYYSGYYPNFDFSVLDSVCELFGLEKKKQIRSLSKGMIRQASLALALAAKPKFLLIDETFDGLDPHKKEILRKLLLEYINETEASVIISSHELGEINGVCDRIAIIKGSKVVLNCPIDGISDSLRKVTVRFSQQPTEETFKSINCKNLTIKGNFASFSLHGNIEEELEKVSNLNAESVDVNRLSLEEVFAEETEVQKDNEKIKRIFK